MPDTALESELVPATELETLNSAELANSNPYNNNEHNSKDDLATIDSREALHEIDLDDSQLELTAGNENENENTSFNVDDPHTTNLKTFMYAAQRGDVTTLSELLESGKVKVNDTLPEDNVTALHWAAINNRLKTVKYLVGQKADIDYKGGDFKSTPLQWCVRYGLVYIADYLIRQCHADVFVVDLQGFNLLHSATLSSNIMMIIYLTKFTKIDINSTDPNKRTSLHWAAYQGDRLTVRYLLKLGATPNIQDSDGFLPLHWSLVKNSRDCIKSLVQSGSDFSLTTNDNKTCSDISTDMNCSDMFNSVLNEIGIGKDGEKIKFIFTERQGKLITFFAPYFVLPLGFSIVTDGFLLFKIIFAVLLFMTQIIVLKRFVISSFLREDPNVMPHSPFFAGLFSSTAFWCIATWLFKILPKTFFDEPFLNFIFLLSSTATVASYFKTMFLDPGNIPSDSNNDEKIRNSIIDLINERKYDSKSFCINTLIRIPLRSRYSHKKQRNIARYDHYCPWTYNDIALRNHKLFFGFIISLEIALITYRNLAYEYFDELDLNDEIEHSCHILGEELCSGHLGSPFIYNLYLWSTFQLIWLTMLVVGQIVQISAGLTTNELGKRNERYDPNANGGSVPIEEEELIDDQHPIRSGRTNWLRRIFFFVPEPLMRSSVFKVLGITQFFLVTDLLQKENNDRDFGNISGKSRYYRFNYGFITNWLDFLFLKREGENYSIRNLFKLPLLGEANLNRELVDYYTLYEPPVSQNERYELV